jgi:hypothetical protein
LEKNKLLEESLNNDFILLGSRDLKRGEQALKWKRLLIKLKKCYSQIIMVHEYLIPLLRDK